MDLKQEIKKYLNSRLFREGLCIPSGWEAEYVPLAQGEYNMNYSFIHPVTHKKLVLRINTGSQMHLSNQIEYEYHALKELEMSGRTPKAYYVDGTKKNIPYGILVMEFLEGRALDYKKDLSLGAECLADIHCVPVKQPEKFIRPRNPLEAILEECRGMFSHYRESKLGKDTVKTQIARMLLKGEQKLSGYHSDTGYECCVNTELNSGNFLINGAGRPNYLVDWEKPVIGDPAQDLGHFLAPTTTFWKTDVILNREETENFLAVYELAAKRNGMELGNIRERTELFARITCLRGITWCTMAWIDYQNPDKLIRNESTYKKLNAYLRPEFLNHIEREYLGL